MKSLKIIILFIAFISIFPGCKEKDDDDDLPKKEQILRVYVDGKLQQGSSIFAGTNERIENDETIRGFNMIANVDGFDFDINIDNWSWQGLPKTGPIVKTYYPSDDDKRQCEIDDNFNVMCEHATISYYKSRDTVYITRLYDYKDNTVQITRNSENTVDGNFDVVCITSRNDTIHLEGSFNDIEY